LSTRTDDDLDRKIFIIVKDGEPMMLGSCSGDEFRDELHERLWEKAHKKSEKNHIPLVTALRIQIKRAGFEPEEVNSKNER